MKPGDTVKIRSRGSANGVVLRIAKDGSPLALVRWSKDNEGNPMETIFTFKELVVQKDVKS